MGKSSPITCKIPWALRKRIEADCMELGITMSEWQRRAAEEKLARTGLTEQLTEFEERLGPVLIRVGDSQQIMLAYLEQLIKTFLLRVPSPGAAETAKGDAEAAAAAEKAAKAAAVPAWRMLVKTVQRQFGDEVSLNGNGTQEREEL